MALRFDSALIAGALVYGDEGLGVLGNTVLSDGEFGGPPMYPQLLVGDLTKEVRWLITGAPTPAGLTSFFPFENGAFTAAGSDGTRSFNWDFYVDGALRSSHTTTFTIGAVSGIPTLSAATVINITTTTATPQVALTF